MRTRSIASRNAIARAVIAAAGLTVSLWTLQAAQLSFRSLSERGTRVTPRTLGGAFKRLPNGDACFFSNESRAIHVVNLSDGSVQRIPLGETPEDAVASVQLMQDLEIDARGRFYVPAIWTFKEKQDWDAGVLVFYPDGLYAQTVLLRPRTGVRHIALDNAGNLYVLGLDQAYFRRTTDSCFLIHEYTPTGVRVAAFSECPAVASERGNSGAGFEVLTEEVDRGSVWIRNGLLYHLLPFSRTVRIFEIPAGRLTGTVEMQLPEIEFRGNVETSRTLPSMVLRALPLSDGRYFAEWSLAGAGWNAAQRHVVLSLHERSGRAAFRAAEQPWPGGAPLWANEDGSITFIVRQADGTARFVKSELRTQ